TKQARRRPELADLPFIIGGRPQERKPVYDLSPVAAVCGVTQGMPLREAAQRCPQAIFLPVAEGEYRRAFANVLAVLADYNPAVVTGELGRAYLDLRALALPAGGEPQLAKEILAAVHAGTGLAAAVGLAPSLFVAGIAAMQAGPGHARAVIAGQERALLAPLPLDVLPLSGQARRRLRLLGLNTVGALAVLPAEAAAAQLGAEGATAHRLANGRDERRLEPQRQAQVVSEEREFDEPLIDSTHAGLAIDHLVDQLLPRLQADMSFCRRLALRLRLADGQELAATASLREPTQDAALLGRVARRLLAETEPTTGIAALSLTLDELGGPEGRQLTLFAPRQGGLAKLTAAVARLQASLGAGRLRKAVVLDPQASLPERRYTLVEYK
ncbi:MAG: DNA polymerase Y family protein, partial [Chloroflexota bacterium]